MAGGEFRFGTDSIYMARHQHRPPESTSAKIWITWLHYGCVSGPIASLFNTIAVFRRGKLGLGLAMFIGRFLMIVPMLAVAGSLAQKKIVPISAGTFPTDSPLFVGLVVGVIAITGGLIYFPAVSLGPIVEHFAMHAGTLFDTGS